METSGAGTASLSVPMWSQEGKLSLRQPLAAGSPSEEADPCTRLSEAEGHPVRGRAGSLGCVWSVAQSPVSGGMGHPP